VVEWAREGDVRRSVKRLIERGLVVSGAARLSRWRSGGRVIVLAYHNILPRGVPPVGDRSLHLPQEVFAAQLDLLRATHDVISLSEALARGARSHPRPSVVITFDDAYRGAVTVGIAELARRGMPATIFVPPAFVDGGSFWWDVLTPPGAVAPPPAERARALEQLAGRTEAILEGLPPARLEAVPPHARCASLDELRQACAVPGITLGSHTWSHPNLAALRGAELMEELVRPLTWLRETFTAVVPYLAYPYGRATPQVEDAAEAAGYRAALRIDGGWLPRRQVNPFALPRLNIPAGLSLDGFSLRLAGLLAS
jgi:peptidoglycan/xylan/chitin deacetylase (PgdA/CDA1 family)